MCAPGRNENRFTRVLIHAKALHALILEQLAAEVAVEKEHLRMNRVGEPHRALALLGRKLLNEKVSESVCVFGAINIPDGTTWGLVLPIRGVDHDVDSIRDIHVKSRGALSSWTLEAGERIVHLGTNVRARRTWWELMSAIESLLLT